MSNIHTPKYEKHYKTIIKMYNEGKKAKEIVAALNDPNITKVSQIYKIASRLGITKKDEKVLEKYKEVDEEAVKLIKSGMSCTQVAKKLGIDQQSMNVRLKTKYGLKILPDGKKEIDSHFFDTIDTEEKAYWLGFFYADGYIGTANSIELVVKSSDREHLVKFKKALKSKHLIQDKNVSLNGKTFKAYRVSVKDSCLVEGLKRNGCRNAKTFGIEMPQLSTKELYRHFIRGFFDGDGSIDNHYNSYIGASITCASIDFCQSFSDYLFEVVGIRSVIKPSNSKAYVVTTTSRWEAFRFLQHIYNESNVFLTRKYEQYLNICRLESISQKTLNDKDGIKRGWRDVS